ncbi:MAG: hypothetical protein IJY73_09680 [Oscillospiraceae bacterium]|nr:hypothetical protein [Oscillospiraceae bacterium]
MSKWNTATMHQYLKQACVQGETYKYPIYCMIKNTDFWVSRYDSQRSCYLALSDYRRLLFVEFTMLTGTPVRMGALGFDDLVSAKVKKNIVGQYVFKLEFIINGKKQKFTFQAAKKVYGTDLDEQEQNLMGLVECFEKYGHNLRY